MRQLLIILLLCELGACKSKNKNVLTDEVVREPPTIYNLTQITKKPLDSVDVAFISTNSFSAYSSDKNSVPSNGEAHSNNLPKIVTSRFAKAGLYLTINDKSIYTGNEKDTGIKLFLVNTTDSAITLHASDSRLDIVTEVQDENNRWIQIAYLPTSSCGNSDHKVILDSNEYWEFDLNPLFGDHLVTYRYTLYIDKQHKISSNETYGSMDKKLFDKWTSIEQ